MVFRKGLKLVLGSLSFLRSTFLFCSDLGEASLKVIGVTTEDDGLYTCVAANDLGSVSSSASLRVLGGFASLFRRRKIGEGAHLVMVKVRRWFLPPLPRSWM